MLPRGRQSVHVCRWRRHVSEQMCDDAVLQPGSVLVGEGLSGMRTS
jgi:hypothetical protein